MKLTGKCKEEFDKWAIDKEVLEMSLGKICLRIGVVLVSFYELPNNVRYVFYEDFFDSVGIRTDIVSKWIETKTGEPVVIFELILRGELHSPWGSRLDARKEAIEKANKIYNKRK